MKKIIGLSFIIFSLLFVACENSDVKPIAQDDDAVFEKSAEITVTETQLEAATTEVEYEVEFYANAEDMLGRWWKIGKAWRWNHKLRYQVEHCPEVIIHNGDSLGYPRIITLNYGEEGIELRNGKVLTGQVVIEVSAPKKSKDYTRLVTYNDFGVDSLVINGSSTVTVDKSQDNFRNHNSTLNFVKEGVFEISRTAARTWTWVEGMETLEDQTDDVIHIEGNVIAENGTDIYEKKIVEPLVRKKDCRFIVQGKVEIYLATELIATLDYGDGTCDEVATMKGKGSDDLKEIDLRKHEMKGKQHRKGHGDNAGNQNGDAGNNG